MQRYLGIGFLTAYVATVYAANWAFRHFGTVNVGLGLEAPAGVYFAGLAFTLRDLTHDALGRRWVIAGIVAGAILSAVLSDAWRIAAASGVAFTLSELADLAVYEPLRERSWLRAVVLSNTVGLVVDSALFLAIALGSLTYLPGQIAGKATMTAAAVVILAVVHRDRAPAPAPA